MDKEKTPAEIVGYCRVSTVEQKEQGYSLDAQEKRIRDYAVFKNLNVRQIYRDEGISGADMENRPALLQMLDELKVKDFVVVVSLTRLARNAKQATEIEENIRSKKSYLVALDVDINTKTAAGKLIFQVMNSFSEFERNTTSERVSSTMRYMSSQGRLRTKPPYGYKFVGKKIPFEKDEYEQGVIQAIRSLVKETPGITTTGITQYLNDHDYKCRTAKMWYPGRVKDIMDQNDIS